MMSAHSEILNRREIHQGTYDIATYIEGLDCDSIVLVCTLGAAVHFFSDLSRMLEKEHTYEFWNPKQDIFVIDDRKTYVVVDTVYDTGATFSQIPHCENVFKVCLVSKHHNPDLDYYAHLVSRDKYLYGYGLDLNGRYRNLDKIYYSKTYVDWR